MISKNNLKFAFHHFDSDHDGFITCENLYECFHRQGRGIKPEDVEKMMEEAGLDKSSKLNFEEFERFMTMASQ
jgi:Ca2+-binding EF-hand superfamily protein